jgi:nitrite reductase/ring-hydroxylating ferredoxin subunit
MKHPNVHFFYLSCIVLFLNSSSCVKDKGNAFPYVFVNITINLYSDPEFTHLQADGNSQIILSSMLGITSLGYGNKGLVIYNASGGEFYAFDATCPYDLPEINGVEMTGTSGIVECPKCHSRYGLSSYGMPTVKGPATYPLHEYSAYYFPSTRDLNIRN